MKKEYQEILEYWLHIDFVYVANKAGFISGDIEVKESGWYLININSEILIT